jgi:DNA polymerase I-like protein with 3'-5' exonuclease and polymerase domains
MFTQMDALRATTAMAIAGMKLDIGYVHTQYIHYNRVIKECEEELALHAPDLDHRSNKELSLYFFGGEQKYQEKEHIGFYKNGKPKYKLMDKVRVIPAKYEATADKGASGYYSVDDSVLDFLNKSAGDSVAKHISELRQYYKIRDTYYAGLLGLVFPNNFVYPQLNHCATKTGRLSSNKPNLQNQTDVGDVKKAYVSRFGDEGVILELDYSQLEMVALAFIADDKQLIADINNGRDMHRELYKEMYGRYPTDAERKPFKRFSFLLVYGGGASTLMAQSGCDRKTAVKFISTFYKRYTGVKDYHEKIVKEAKANREVYYSDKKSGPQYRYTLVTPTKRKYVFNAYPSEYTGDMEFSPTELKNWPIQGFATGDVVPMMVGKLQRKLDEMGVVEKRQAVLVMTVHDSVLLDVHTDVLYNVASAARDVLQSAPQEIKRHFGIDFPCKLSVGVDAGYNWQDTEEYEM